jgi:hypothetical protein
MSDKEREELYTIFGQEPDMFKYVEKLVENKLTVRVLRAHKGDLNALQTYLYDRNKTDSKKYTTLKDLYTNMGKVGDLCQTIRIYPFDENGNVENSNEPVGFAFKFEELIKYGIQRFFIVMI